MSSRIRPDHEVVFSFFPPITYLFLAALGLGCCSWAFSSCGKWGLLFVVVPKLIVVVAFVEEYRL